MKAFRYKNIFTTLTALSLFSVSNSLFADTETLTYTNAGTTTAITVSYNSGTYDTLIIGTSASPSTSLQMGSAKATPSWEFSTIEIYAGSTFMTKLGIFTSSSQDIYIGSGSKLILTGSTLSTLNLNGNMYINGGTYTTAAGSTFAFKGTISGNGTISGYLDSTDYTVYLDDGTVIAPTTFTDYDNKDTSEAGAGTFTVTNDIQVVSGESITVDIDFYTLSSNASNNSFDKVLFDTGVGFAGLGTVNLTLDFTDLTLDFGTETTLTVLLADFINGFETFDGYEEIEVIGATVIDDTTSDYDYALNDGTLVSFGENSIIFTTTAVPEPSTYAMILGAFALGFAYYRRRK